MNSIYTIFAILFLILTAQTTIGQEKKKEVRKEFRMEEQNGVKTLFVTTIENGVTTEEVFKGDEADAKLKEFIDQQPQMQKEIKKEIDVREHGGEKTVSIRTTEDGKITEEVFTGLEAEKKLKEVGAIEMTQQQIVVEETVIKTKKKKRSKKSK